MKKQQYFLSFLILALIGLFVIDPKNNIDATLNGIIVWGTSLLPALFPFFFFTKILTELGFVEKISKYLAPITNKLYNTPGVSAYVYVMSILSGYPVGAKITSDLYENKLITYGQACRITSFTSTSGPLFIIGTVGIGMFFNKYIGLAILISHFVGALINGLLYRNYHLKKEKQNNVVFNLNTTSKENILEAAMYNSIKSILIIGGYIALFFMIITMLNNFNLLSSINFLLSNLLSFFKIPPSIAPSITNAIIEITRGCLDLSLLTTNPKISSVVASFIISFGGFSTHMQALTFLRKFKINVRFYLLQKITHAIIATSICLALVQVMF